MSFCDPRTSNSYLLKSERENKNSNWASSKASIAESSTEKSNTQIKIIQEKATANSHRMVVPQNKYEDIMERIDQLDSDFSKKFTSFQDSILQVVQTAIQTAVNSKLNDISCKMQRTLDEVGDIHDFIAQSSVICEQKVKYFILIFLWAYVF